MKKEYASPKLVEYGRIADCTFQTPGSGTKSTDTTFQLDSYGEYSHPASTSGS
jgi:hypothetical protein